MSKNMSFFIVSAVILSLLAVLPAAGTKEHLEGRALVQDRCTVCHNLQRVRQKIGEYDAGAWNYYVTRMQENGARVTDSEKASIVEFLVLLESGGDL